MRVFLVKPPSPSYSLDFLIETPPLGLEYIASYIEDSAEVKILDAKAENLTVEGTAKKIEDFEPDLVGISLNFAPTTPSAIEIARLVKENTKAKVVFGGQQATFIVPHLLGSGFADVVVRGEGEITFAELLQKREPEGIEGLSYLKSGKIVHNPSRSLIENLDFMKPPARHFVNGSKYHLFGLRMDVVESSRGCPFDCYFCSIKNFHGRRWRARSPENVIKEIEGLLERKTEAVLFVDDNFTVDMKRVGRICDLLMEKGLEIFYFCQARADSIANNPDIVTKMAEAGFRLMLIGIESSNQSILDSISKKLTKSLAEEAVELLHKNDIAVWGTFMIGFPDEEPESMEQTIEFAKLLDVEVAQFTILTPVPGSDIYKKCKEEGLLISEDWGDFDFTHSVMKANMPKEEIEETLQKAYKEYYLRSSFMRRIFSKSQSKREEVMKLIAITGWEYSFGSLIPPRTIGDWKLILENAKGVINPHSREKLKGYSVKVQLLLDIGKIWMDIRDGELSEVRDGEFRSNLVIELDNDTLVRLVLLANLNPVTAFLEKRIKSNASLKELIKFSKFVSILQNIILKLKHLEYQPD